MDASTENQAGAEISPAAASVRRRCLGLAGGLLAAVPAFAAVLVFLRPLAAGWEKMAPGWVILLGMLPLHGAGCGALVAAAGCSCGWPRLPAILDLVRPGERWRPLARRLAVTLLWVYPATLALTLAMVLFLRHFGWNPVPSVLVDLLAREGSPWRLGLAAVALVAWAPLAEELLFRLALHDCLLPLIGRGGAAAATAALFAVMHQIPEQIPGLILLGLVLQHLRSRANSLWPCVLLHGMFNGTSLLIMVVCRLLGVEMEA